MPVTIQRADTALFDAAGKGDFSFLVEAFYEPIFGKPVAGWAGTPVTPYIKSYNKPGDDTAEDWDPENGALFVAMLDGRPVGRISVKRNWNGYGLLDHFGVDTPHRAGGIGGLLFSEARAWAQVQRLPGLTLETQSNNFAACRFYERQGFELGGIDRFFYRGLDPETREIALFWYQPFDVEP